MAASCDASVITKDLESKGTEGNKDDEIIVIRTTQAKLKEAEAKMLEIKNLNEVPGAVLKKYSMFAFIMHWLSALILFGLATKSTYHVALWTNYPSAFDNLVPNPHYLGQYSMLWLGTYLLKIELLLLKVKMPKSPCPGKYLTLSNR